MLDITSSTEGGGLIVGTGDLLSEITLADYHKVIGILPSYAEDEAAWYTSKWVWANSMQRLALAAGGNTADNIQGGAMGKMFLGFPVVVVTGTIYPKTDTTSQMLATFGNLAQSSTFGDRRTLTMRITETEDDARKDLVSVISRERFDINNHDLGTATVAGPIVGLMSKGS